MRFPLLSDPDSEIIERFGILNTLIEADDHPWYGIPFPGSYVVDGDGVIIAKFFEASLSLRANADQLRRAATGEEIVLEAAAPPAEVTATVALDGDSLAVGVLRDLVVTLRVPEGQHLYGEPVPDGMVATRVELDESAGLISVDPQYPPTRPHVLRGTGEELQIFEGDVVIRVPVTHNQRLLDTHDDGSLTVRVGGTIRWQSCDDDVCHLPATHRFALDVPAVRANLPELLGPDSPRRDAAIAHYRRMIERRT